ncbi:sigma-54-dependent Fis family transcriptional regulator [Candidatus Woesearchaeota archaeon]|nr:sigma-54-dependent Fis family transcriptional regulator [Candidatus Woesearchaeota archaeon]
MDRSLFEKYGMIGKSPEMERVYDTIARVANSNVTVFIIGESGVGKELVASALHTYGKRKEGPYVPVNVSEFGDDQLLEANLFGIEKGVATGVGERDGLFQQADKGTLFLDEIAEMSPAMQVKLLRVLQERKIVRIGGKRATPLPLDVRIVTASNRPLEDYLQEGSSFRSDLYYRLRQVYITIPSLRERYQDVPLLADYFLERANKEEGKNVCFSKEAYEWFLQYSWPGNVRELENAVIGAVALAGQSQELQPEDFLISKIKNQVASNLTGKKVSVNEDAFIFDDEGKRILCYNDLKQRYLEAVLRHTGGNTTAAARLSGIDRSSFHRTLRRLKSK